MGLPSLVLHRSTVLTEYHQVHPWTQQVIERGPRVLHQLKEGPQARPWAQQVMEQGPTGRHSKGLLMAVLPSMSVRFVVHRSKEGPQDHPWAQQVIARVPTGHSVPKAIHPSMLVHLVVHRSKDLMGGRQDRPLVQQVMEQGHLVHRPKDLPTGARL
jgi:hypothetical protein